MTSVRYSTELTAKVLGISTGLTSYLPLDVVSGSIELNENTAPYAEARLTVALPEEAYVAQIDPRAGQRIELTGTVAFDYPEDRADQTRTFNLYLHDRVVNHANGTLDLIAESDEALLIGYRRLAATSERTYGLSVKDAVAFALAKVGATLEAGAADATLDGTAHKTVTTNLFPNPNARAGIGNMVGNGGGTVTRQTGLTGGPVTGVTTYFRNTAPTGAAGFYGQTDTAAPYCLVDAGKTYNVSVWLRASVASKVVSFYNEFYTAAGSGLGNPLAGTFTTSATPGTWTRLSWTVTAPATAARFGPNLNATGWTSGQTFDSLGWQVTEGTTLYDAFDGNSVGATLGEGFYWTGTPNASSSVKVDQPAVTNLITNPSGETNTTGWVGSAGTLAQVSQTFGSGASALQLTASGADSFIAVTGENTTAGYQFGMVPGRTYTISAVGRVNTVLSSTAVATDPADGNGSAQTSRERALVVHTYNGSTYTVYHSAQVPNTAGSSARVSVTFTVPANAIAVFVRLYAGRAAGVMQWDSVMLTDGGTLVDYFDGASTSSTYGYLWTGTAHASQSVRVGPHNADATVWTPGVSAWEFVKPLVDAGGLMLFCDEQRKWRLVNPSTYLLDGVVVVSQGTNATAGTDRISLQATHEDGTPVYYSGLQINYEWTDAAGVQQKAYDFAGTPANAYVMTVDRPYPGPGAAAAILARAEGRGRTQDVSALTDLTATPRMGFVTTLPGLSAQIGVLSSVIWHWDAESASHGVMDVGSRGLAVTPSNAWILAIGAWNAATGTWAGATGTN